MPRVAQQSIGGILAKRQLAVGDNPPIKIVTLKGEYENCRKQRESRCASDFTNSTPGHQCANIAVFDEGGNFALQLIYCSFR